MSSSRLDSNCMNDMLKRWLTVYFSRQDCVYEVQSICSCLV